jgi:hypothetical protein
VSVEDLRLRPIVQLDAVETRSREWCNVVTCHEGDSNAYVWRFDHRAIGQVRLVVVVMMMMMMMMMMMGG